MGKVERVRKSERWKFGSSIDLRAQVKDTAVLSYSWNTTDISGIATNITGASTYRLRFNWTTNNPVQAGQTKNVTLTVTGTGGVTEVQTYTFHLPGGQISGSGGSSAPTWPNTLAPGLILPGSDSFYSHNVAVASITGSAQTGIVLPTYNPNFAPLVLEYDSLAADARPIVVVHHPLDDTKSIPTQVSSKLTFNSSAQSTYYYDTSQFIPGDFVQMALSYDATALSTGRYSYSVTTEDIRNTTTTTTYSGSTNLINEASSNFGAGWTLAETDRIHSATGGVILSLGLAQSLWFATAGSGYGGVTNYTTPAGDFSTLVKNSSGTYTRTLRDGTKQEFDSNGRQTAFVDRNSLRLTYTYDGSGKLTKRTDPYGGIVTFTYDGSGKISTITDPASRVATFTLSSDDLTNVTLPDSAAWSFSYDSAHRLNKVTDPRSKAVTITYDAANRVSETTRPDLTTEEFWAYQTQGWVASGSGTSGSPAPAVLLAESASTYTDPRSNDTDVYPDWRGMGLTNQVSDPNGNISTVYRDTNGLATVSIDRLNRPSKATYDSKGNVLSWTYPDLNKVTFTYNSFSEPLTFIDARGKTTSFSYDANGNMTSMEDPLHNRTTMTYTSTGQVATVKDARNNVTTYQYDSQDRATTITFPDNNTQLLAYDSKSNVVTSTDERSNSTTYSYDALNRITGMTDALGNRTTAVYDSGGNITQVQAPLSRTTDFAYDSMDRLTTITAPLSRVTVLGYDESGNQITTQDPLNRISTVTYDALDRPTVATSPLTGATNRTVTVSYDAEGQILTSADPLNRITTYTYNSRGWVATKTDPLGNTVTYSYTATGKASSYSDPSNSGGSLMDFTYDDNDRLIDTRDALGHRNTMVYDAVSNVIAQVDANNNRTTYSYDSRNRLTTITDALSHSTVLGYDAAGNQVTIKDALNNTTTIAYDALNQATTQTDARGGVITVAYDGAGRTTGLTDPVGNRTTWSYDAGDRMTTMTDALGTATYAYDAADQLIDKTDRAGRRTTFAFDSGGRRTNERWFNGSTILRTLTFTYDAADQMTGATDPDATLTFTYDSGGRMTSAATSSAAGQPNVTLSYTYNESGDRVSMTDNLSSVGRTTYSYDAAHRLTTMTRSIGGTAGPQVVFGYDAANQKTSISRTIGGTGTAVTSSFAYDNANRLTTLTHQVSGGSGLATYVYGYDDVNRVTSETNAEGSVTYTYDATSQLTGVTGARSESYSYDLNGNRTMTGYSTGAGNQLTASPGYTYSYDGDGNLASKTETATGKVTTFSYDHRNRTTGATRTSGSFVEMRATYVYDGFDRRIGVNVDADGDGSNAATTTWIVHDGVNPYADFDGAGALQQRYLYGLGIDFLLAKTNVANASVWYLPDQLGSVRDVVNASGTVIGHRGYDSFGQIVLETGTSNDRFGYTSREYNKELANYYYRARYFDPEMGRFVSFDPLGFASGDKNLYGYCINSPVNYSDPSGLSWRDVPKPGRYPLPNRSTTFGDMYDVSAMRDPKVYKDKYTKMYMLKRGWSEPPAGSQWIKTDSGYCDVYDWRNIPKNTYVGPTGCGTCTGILLIPGNPKYPIISIHAGYHIPKIPYVRDGNYMAIVTGVNDGDGPTMPSVNVLNMAIRNLLAQGVRNVTYSPGQGVLIGRYDHQSSNPIYILSPTPSSRP